MLSNQVEEWLKNDTIEETDIVVNDNGQQQTPHWDFYRPEQVSLLRLATPFKLIALHPGRTGRLTPNVPQVLEEPYRQVLVKIRAKLERTIMRCEHLSIGKESPSFITAGTYYRTADELMEPLMIIYNSLKACGDGFVAEGSLKVPPFPPPHPFHFP